MNRIINPPADLYFTRVTVSDLDKLIRISTQTYSETFFEAFGDPVAYNAYTGDAFSAERLKAELTNPDMVFYFAAINRQVVGYIKLNYHNGQTVFQGNKAAELERIYVLAEYQHRQIGRSLMEHAIKMTQAKGLECLWLAVWQHNHKALKFYQSRGLTQFATYNYAVGGDPQTDILMRICFNASEIM